MNSRAFSLAVAALAAVSFAVPASAQQELLQRCNGSFADVETIAKRVLECREWSAGMHAAESSIRASSAALSKSTTGSPDVVISTIVVSPDMAKAVISEPKLTDRLALYYAYDGFATGDAGRCSALTHVVATEQPCREAFDELSFTRSVLGPRQDFIRGCLRRRDMATRDLTREKLVVWCTAIADSYTDPAGVCAKLMPLFSGKSANETAPSTAECRGTFQSLNGDDSGCAAFPADRRATCRADALFARAYKARNGALCAGNQRCRVLMGEGKQVARELAAEMTSPAAQWVLRAGWQTTIKQTAPGQVTRPAPPPSAAATVGKAPETFKGFVCSDPFWSEANRKAAQSTVKAAQVCLTDIDAVATPSLALAQGIDSRLERIARLQIQINASLEPVGQPGKAPARKPRP